MPWPKALTKSFSLSILLPLLPLLTPLAGCVADDESSLPTTLLLPSPADAQTPIPDMNDETPADAPENDPGDTSGTGDANGGEDLDPEGGGGPTDFPADPGPSPADNTPEEDASAEGDATPVGSPWEEADESPPPAIESPFPIAETPISETLAPSPETETRPSPSIAPDAPPADTPIEGTPLDGDTPGLDNDSPPPETSPFPTDRTPWPDDEASPTPPGNQENPSAPTPTTPPVADETPYADATWLPMTPENSPTPDVLPPTPTPADATSAPTPPGATEPPASSPTPTSMPIEDTPDETPWATPTPTPSPTPVDADGDGYAAGPSGDDCDDSNPAVHPDAIEVAGNTLDEDCDGRALDQDGDHSNAVADGGGDCDDLNPAIQPDALEEINGLDDDCDGSIDEALNPNDAEFTLTSADLEGNELTMAFGDIDNDGRPDLAVGNPTAFNTSGDATGAVFVFFNVYAFDDETTGSADAIVYGELDGDRLGASIGLADLTGDGSDDLIVGVPGADEDNTSPGRVMIFAGENPHWQPRGTPEDADGVVNGLATADRFGAALDILEDMNGDGFPEILVGAPGTDCDGGTGCGQVSLFGGASFTGASTAQYADATAKGGTPSGELGLDVVGLSDVNGDHLPDLLLGEKQDSSTQVYTLFFGNEELSRTLSASASTLFAGSGVSLMTASPAADLDGDGVGDILLGAPDYANGSGRVFVIFGSSSWASSLDVEAAAGGIFFGTSGGDRFGSALVGADVTGDGLSDILAQADDADNGASALYLFAGQAHSYWGTATTDSAAVIWLGMPGGLTYAGHPILREPDDEQPWLLATPTQDEGTADGTLLLYSWTRYE